MDLTTLFAAIIIAFGLLTFETVRTADRAIVEVADLPRMERTSIDQITVEQEFASGLNSVARVTSVMVPPEIRTNRDVGIGKAIASALKINDLSTALEADLGYSPDRLRLALVNDNGVLHAVISGRGRRVGTFRETLTPREGEKLLEFVRRCSLVGASKLAPYGTGVFLVQEGARTRNLQPARTLLMYAKAALPNTPINPERSLYENLDGIVALLDNDVPLAQAHFYKAIDSDPNNVVALLNAAFTEIQLGNYAKAEEQMNHLLTASPPDNKLLLSTAFMTEGAALLGMKRPQDADLALARAAQVNPDNSGAYFLWGDVKEALGDHPEAERLRREAFQTNDSLENYAEVATLYFHLARRDNAPLSASPFSNPTVAK